MVIRIAIDQVKESIRAKEKLQTAVSLLLELISVTYLPRFNNEQLVDRQYFTLGLHSG